MLMSETSWQSASASATLLETLKTDPGFTLPQSIVGACSDFALYRVALGYGIAEPNTIAVLCDRISLSLHIVGMSNDLDSCNCA